MLQAFGGHVLWSQLPAYLIGEFVGGALGGLTWAAIGRVRADATVASLAPTPDRNRKGSVEHVMKKLINSPETVVTDALAGIAAAHRRCRWTSRTRSITRADGPRAGQGRPGVRRRLRSRAAARRLRRLRHARRGLPGRGVHLPGARPDAGRDQGRQRRRRRAAHREELHRRRAQLPDGGRAGRRRRHRGRLGRGQRRRRGAGLALHRRAAAASAPRSSSEKIAGALAEEGAALAAVAAVAARGQRAEPVVRRRADLVHGPRGGQADLRARRGRDRSSASASTASPAATRATADARPRAGGGRAGRHQRRHAASAATCWSWSTAWAAPR